MKIVIWEGKGKVLEGRDGISNPGFTSQKGRGRQNRKKKNPPTTTTNQEIRITKRRIEPQWLNIRMQACKRKGEREERAFNWARKWKPVK